MLPHLTTRQAKVQAMNVDTLTIAAVVEELQQTILGGRVQHVLLPGPLSIGLEIFGAGRRHQLLASANPRSARLHLVSSRLSRGVEQETPLLLLLRKYVRGGIITAIEQPELERIVVLSITKYPSGRKDEEDEEDDDPQEERHCELVIELLGNRANLILLDDDNLILDAAKRVPGRADVRSIFPRAPYELPPQPANRFDPRDASLSAVGEARARTGDLARTIPAVYTGVSPQLAREALARAAARAGTQEAVTDALIAEELRRLFSDPFAPSLAWDGEQPIAFAPYLMQQYDDVRPVPSISSALETFFAASERLTAHAQRRDQLLGQLGEVRMRCVRQCEALERELERAQALDLLRWEGEMIYAYAHAIEPRQTLLTVEDKQIRLDPQKTPSENAQARFRAYDKAKGALTGVPERLAAAQGQLNYLDESIALLELADGYEAIAMIERELTEQGLIGGGRGRPKGPRSRPLQLRSSEGVEIWVGRSAGQNEEITFNLARPDDIWLHARGIPGSHVVVRTGDNAGDDTLLEAAGLAAYFSKARGSTSVEVSLCQRRHVRKVAGGPPGLVTFRNERTIRVAPLSPEQLTSGSIA